jgi:hypothetical protein
MRIAFQGRTGIRKDRPWCVSPSLKEAESRSCDFGSEGSELSAVELFASIIL